jgi:hypothetical protein
VVRTAAFSLSPTRKPFKPGQKNRYPERADPISHCAWIFLYSNTRVSIIDSIAAAVEIRTFKARQAEGVAHRDDPLTTGARSAEDGPMPRSTIKEYT